MQKISSGVKNLDTLIDSLYIGDNIVWEVDAGTSYDVFMQNFINQSFQESQTIVYVSFNSSPQSILGKLKDFIAPDHFILFDCFTSGKGKNDDTFLKFYKNKPDLNIVRIENPKSIEQFTQKLNQIEESLSPGARYVFNSLTGMQDLWGTEDDTYKFFTYMCPRLYDLETVAYWILEKDAHSQKFKANLRHITQVVFELYKRREELYIKTHKLEGRQDREPFKPHAYEIKDSSITISFPKKGVSTEIGNRIKEARIRLGMSQKGLADKVDLTPSFISQVESNQISPSLSSFVLICSALGVNPGQFLEEKGFNKASWLLRKEKILTGAALNEEGILIYPVTSDDNKFVKLIVFPPNASLGKHFLYQRTEEFIYVLKGKLSVTVEGKEEKVKEGDSIYLKEDFPSQWKNEGGDEAELLVVC
jgi:transcriptional regulator with XRE-family HTH domain